MQSDNGQSQMPEPLFLIRVNDKIGLINRAGQIVIEPRFEQIYDEAYDCCIADKTFSFKEDKKWGLADRNGNIILEPQFDRPVDFTMGMARVKSGEQVWYIDENGNRVTPPWPVHPDEWILRLAGGGYLVDTRSQNPRKKHGKMSYVFLDPAGNILGSLPPGAHVEWYESEEERLFPTELPGNPPQCGFVDETGSFVVEPQFAAVNAFSEGLAPVAIGTHWSNHTWGYIDRSGTFVIEPYYRDYHELQCGPPVRGFHEGLAVVDVFRDPVTGRQWHNEGYIDRSGVLVIEPQFAMPSDFSEGLASVLIEGWYWRGKVGFIDHSGSFAIPPRFTKRMQSPEFHYGIAAVALGEDEAGDGIERGYIDRAGQCIWGSERFRRLLETTEPVTRPVPVVKVRSREAELSRLEALPAPSFEPLFPIQENEKWGFINRRGEMVVEPQYDAIPDSYDDIWQEDNEWLNSSLLGVKSGEKWGYINRTGDVVIEPQYKWVHPFSEGLAAVTLRNNHVTYINENGDRVFHARWRFNGNFHENRALILLSPRSTGTSSQSSGDQETPAYIDRTGEIVFTVPQNWQAYDFVAERALVKVAEKRWGYLDHAGAMVIEPEFARARPFSEGRAAVAVTSQAGEDLTYLWGYIDPSGEYRITPRYEDKPFMDLSDDFEYGRSDEHRFSEGLAVMEAEIPQITPSAISHAYGYVDARGNYVIPPRFTHAAPFSGGLALVSCPEFPYSGYINSAGELVIPPKFGPMIWGGYFHHGLARVNLNAGVVPDRWLYGRGGEWGYINTLGECVWGSPQFRRFLEMEWW